MATVHVELEDDALLALLQRLRREGWRIEDVTPLPTIGDVYEARRGALVITVHREEFGFAGAAWGPADAMAAAGLTPAESA
ncbi:MAG: hypothetical protein KC613_00320 [Myxococcales bacterium]|nr:hypothetical protein [Myxococcales bacterium]MCB9525881.1 hypothetical protein [Myxococcales bacterium]